MARVTAGQVRSADSEKTVEDRRHTLRQKLEKTRDRIATLEVALNEKLDSDLGRGDPAVTQREVNRALVQRLRARAEELEQALSQLNQGRYGECSRCGRPIHPDRLAVLPDTRLCIECARSGGNT
jgi:RNA polymerase-binding transcription factor DksA